MQYFDENSNVTIINPETFNNSFAYRKLTDLEYLNF